MMENPQSDLVRQAHRVEQLIKEMHNRIESEYGHQRENKEGSFERWMNEAADELLEEAGLLSKMVEEREVI